MDDDKATKIQEFESRLRNAVIHSDIAELDKLLAEELIFTTHLGRLIRKSDDLAAHQSGLVKIDEWIPSDEHMIIVDGVAIVSVQMQISGVFNGAPSKGLFRFTRVWKESPDGTWKVVAGQSTLVA